MMLSISFKREWRSILMMVLIVVLVMANFTVPQAASAAETPAVQAQYFVSPSGNDANPGTIDEPFRTIQHARDIVRSVNASMTGDIYVYLRGGNYQVSSTIEFTPSDSGTNGYHIIYQAYPNETPVLNGGVQVTGWTQHAGNIWKAPLDRSNKLRALYVNDKRALMASKTINSLGCYGTYAITAGQADWAWESGSQCDGAKYNLTDFPNIQSNQADVEIETRTTWNTAIVGVRQVTTTPDGANRVALFQEPGAAIAQGSFNGNFQIGGSHKIMNAYEFLDAPGEFYYDRTNKTVYYYKADNEDMTAAQVYAPNNVATILKVAGASTSDHVRNLTFDGITVEHSDWNLSEIDGSVFKQVQQGNLSAIAYAKQNFHAYNYRNVDTEPSAIDIENADGIMLLNSKVEHTGADGISMVNDVSNSKLIGNAANDIGGAAISIGHPQHVYIGDYTSTNHEKYAVDREGVCKNIEIKNNYLYDSGVLFNGSAAIQAFFVDSLSIQHNRIEKTPYVGISLGWGWWNFDGSSGSIVPGVPTTTAQNNDISYNQIIDTMQKLDDGAPIYTLGNQPTTMISNNYLKGVPAGHKYGLHPDEGSAYINFSNNVLDIDPNIMYTINSDDWGRKHDLSITQTYSNVNKISNKNLPSSVVEDILYYQDSVWPLAGYNIALNAGLEGPYRHLASPSHTPVQDAALPASVYINPPTVSIPIQPAGDAANTVWLAPVGTTNFIEGPSMTKANGDAASIAVPQTAGTYHLYVVNAQGNPSAPSQSVVRYALHGTGQVVSKPLTVGKTSLSVDGSMDAILKAVAANEIKDANDTAIADFRTTYDDSYLYLFANVHDTTKDAADKVQVYINGTNPYTLSRDNSTVQGTNYKIAETSGGYRLEAAVPLDHASGGQNSKFDLRVTDGHAAGPVAWNDPDNADTDLSHFAALTWGGPLRLTYVIHGTPTGFDDPQWNNADQIVMDQFVQGTSGATGTAKTMWDDQYLYVRAEIHDPILRKDSRNPWEQDSIEIFVDQDHKRTSNIESDDGQYRINFANEQTVDHRSSGSTFDTVTSTVSDAGGQTAGYNVFARIKLDRIAPQIGTLVGFDVSVNNSDNDKGMRDSVAVWCDVTGQQWQNSSNLGTALLVQDIPSDTGGDQAPPTTTYTIDPETPSGTNGWYNKDVTISLHAEDNANGSGVSGTEYRMNNGEWISYQAPFTLSADGRYQIDYRSVDHSGNVEPFKTFEVNIDRTAPQLAISLDQTMIWPANKKMVPIHVAVASSDSVSGLESVVLTSITSNEKLQPTDIQKANYNVPLIDSSDSFEVRADRSGDGDGRVYTITYTAKDLAGNAATASVNVTVPHDQSNK
ncbi:right-handed parallel beta-helix repeat-containing protein [Paenibacillus sp. PR3]|uniref:Right-handed parallel beta-helix repeat-containing protein n=1 Tax=Paenibacillus terricola TaxID=2763503 RepID=A0ABR8MU48_9BACL|nr:sugar-binding protein [Paenibacillus terricola]MBD3919479.1 right-handed parallel beta-helix repeat-containing protein [Paenibacillus terricola]